jgi:hypothetical protein
VSEDARAEMRVERRDFLRMVAVGLGAAATIALPRVAADARHRRVKLRTSYRLSTHGRHACSACKAHAGNRWYRTAAAADTDRAHLGCNCAIVTQPIPNAIYHCFFCKRDVYDRRRRRAKCRLP